MYFCRQCGANGEYDSYTPHTALSPTTRIHPLRASTTAADEVDGRLKALCLPRLPREGRHPGPSNASVKPSHHLAYQRRNCSKSDARDVGIQKEAGG